MTNPDNALGTNAAFNGRTSVNAFNDDLQLVSGRGILSGWSISPNTGLTVAVGGIAGVRDVAVAEDDNGNRTTINNRSGLPVALTIPDAPESGSRIDLIVAYVENPASTEEQMTDNPSIVGLLTISGTASNSPTAPTENDIRTAITADGASGTTAYYVVLGSVTIPAGTTDITDSMITQGQNVKPSIPLPVSETFAIAAADWAELADSDPFGVSATVTATTPIEASSTVELINNQAVLFANYGFSIGAVSGQNITLYALEAPEETVNLTIEIS